MELGIEESEKEGAKLGTDRALAVAPLDSLAWPQIGGLHGSVQNRVPNHNQTLVLSHFQLLLGTSERALVPTWYEEKPLVLGEEHLE